MSNEIKETILLTLLAVVIAMVINGAFYKYVIQTTTTGECINDTRKFSNP